mgnify:CR=1 FL=1
MESLPRVARRDADAYGLNKLIRFILKRALQLQSFFLRKKKHQQMLVQIRVGSITINPESWKNSGS